MRIFLFLFYIISLAVSVAIFYFTQALSPKVSDGYVGGNGNPGLMFFVLGYPFLAFFIYGTIEYLMRYLIKKRTRNWFNPSLVSAGIFAAGILAYTFWSASQVRMQLAKEIPHYGSVADISLINPYTNGIFFNWLTFLAILLFCYSAGGFWAKKRKNLNEQV